MQLNDARLVAPVTLNIGLAKQSTNVHVLLGPMISRDDGSIKTSLTLGDITAAVIKGNGTVARTALTLAGSGSNQFTHVADGYWELDLNPWDVSAGALIVAEAGGRVSDLIGGPVPHSGGQIVASNGRLHESMLRVLAAQPNA